MKGRESGMPPQEAWERFFNPGDVLATLQLDATINDVAEFGCGYGTFTISAAGVIRGTIHAIDIDPVMIEATKKAATDAGRLNVCATLRDVVADGTGLQAASIDYVMLFHLLHIEHSDRLLQEAWRILRVGGRLGIMHWNYDPATPRGPSMAIRPRPEQCIRWAEAVGFSQAQQHVVTPYHYGIVMRK